MRDMNPELSDLLADLESRQTREWPEDMHINGYKLVCTCMACPEQYDVFKNESKVGLLEVAPRQVQGRLPGRGGKTVYESKTEGDGIFEDVTSESRK
jgi:hypothetical protein